MNNDLISRSELKKAIEKYRPISTVKSTFIDGRHSMFMDCIIEIDNAPTVDVKGEKIIRCPDCKYYHKRWHSDKRMKEKGYLCCWCDCHDDWVGGKDGFCSLAERKEDETNN